MNIHFDLNRAFIWQVMLTIAVALHPASTIKAQKIYSPVDYVNPLMGSASTYELSSGNTYPAIALPWGMNFWTPQTGRMGDGWQYTYTANKIRGIKQTHQPSPWINDYGQFSVMPTVGKIVFDEDERASWFSHKAEKAHPYYYSVYLADYDITAEVTPTERAAMMQFTFPKTDKAHIIFDAFDRGSEIVFDWENNIISGYTTRNSGGVPAGFRNYFVAIIDKNIEAVAIVDNGIICENRTSTTCNHAGLILTFSANKGEKVTLRIASSFISREQAMLNLQQEIGQKTFETIKNQGRNRWNEMLGRISVDDENIDNLRTFYSCLYRSILFPRMLYEYDESGNAVHYSPYNGQIQDGYMFTDTGFWDTFRALFPLLNLVYPEINTKIQSGLANCYRESGFLPEWSSPGHRDCMVGNNSASVVADAIVKGITADKDKETLWEAVTKGANAAHKTISSTGRLGFDYYNRLGYVPCDVGINESVARTLEYAYDDWCIYQMGLSLGKSEPQLSQYRNNANNYKNVFDRETRLMRGRKADGLWQTPFVPLKWGDAFTEGNAWHYTWSVFHDVDGLVRLMGGKRQFTEMLDSVFAQPPAFDESYYGQVIHEIREMQISNMGNYAHGNQPIQHTIYLYNYVDESQTAQYWIREVMDRLYQATPDGYPGDEDNGQTSAWYVFSAMGFYPVCPASNDYIVGSPLFKRVTISLPNGRKTTIESSNPQYRYIDRITVDGKKRKQNILTYAELTRGCSIKFEMKQD